ncbi:ABC transporter [Sinorhizobium meliloti]|nr:ABC transporter [Sinorhizobium meliloti]
MSRMLVVMIALLSVAGLTACDTIGKGKGKAPPPAAVDTVEPAPVYK